MLKKVLYLLLIIHEIIILYVNHPDKTVIVKQMEIAGRTEEETKQLNHIVIENWDEINEFLCDYPSEYKGVSIYSFDFNGDGQGEIIMSKEYVDNIIALVSYNYVFDCEGKRILEFAGASPSDMEIHTAGSKDHLFYLRSHINFAAHNDLWLYGEILECDGNLEGELAFIEWDTRYEVDRNDNVDRGYFVFSNFEKEEIDGILWNGYEGIVELSQTKETVDANMLKNYIATQNNPELKEIVPLGTIIYGRQNDKFVWLSLEEDEAVH